ncbi:ZINC FINGER PROTEIN [Salix purpurea]|uniref:ZINC FINGER PROTEIN n=1 Tax=Salix purpurea TaxID=77065 RepID=A0A9Q0W9N0_SALPP|nr:ZINC FINGER PROTEIN [Salix purpurea]KAJ6763232.1 ZINC FINGER PROTEIN [Salix purpurea]
MSSNATRFLMLLTTTTTVPYPLRYPSILRLTRHHIHPSLSSLSRHHNNLFTLSLPRPLKFNSSPSQHHHQLHTSAHFSDSPSPSTSTSFPSTSGFSEPWPEWSSFVNNLSASGYFNTKHGSDNPIDDLTSVDDLPEGFLRSCTASLAFARDKPQALGMLSRRDIEVVVQSGFPFLFKNSDDSVRRMGLFLHGSDSNVPNTDKAQTVDLMKFLLSYASSFVSSVKTNLHNVEHVESSVRSLFSELAQLGYNTVEGNLYGSFGNQFSDRYGQTPRPRGQNIEMKRGDWICPGCSFMNFARNVKCLECDEKRPKRQLTGGEWECPQCDFYNYARNMVCLRCDCKRPGDVSPDSSSSRSDIGYGSGSNVNKNDLVSRLAANEKKAQQWYGNGSQMDSSLDRNGAITDEDFPEIMPLRKGVNRFVVSTRKTPLERRLANSQYQENMGTDDTRERNDIQSIGTTNPLNQTTTRSPASQLLSAPRGSNSDYVPFVPLPADMFAKKPENSKMEREKLEMVNNDSLTSSIGEQKGVISEHSEYGKSRDSCQPSEMPVDQTLSDDNEKDQAEKSERWFKRVAELHNVTDLTSAISDDDFPEIMPLRKGENKFVVSKKKDRSLTSPMNKRHIAMEQANTTSSVPFVPFPPNYFAKKDNQLPDETDSHDKGVSETSSSATLEKHPEKLDGVRLGVTHAAQEGRTGAWSGENKSDLMKGATYGESASGNFTQNFIDPLPPGRDSWNTGDSRRASVTGTPNLMGNSMQNLNNSIANSNDSESCGSFQKENISEKKPFMGTAPQSSKNQSAGDGWTGKSLEGSAVKELDPLDMSEEAKAERWFRRVAQIKDISELSQIPDEDFPSIMPMRKGVNRFVVSKRKTPLERRLTSTQYRRNLPIVSSDPVNENDSS